ncbi:myelin protein zero-like protein 2b [Centroberyx gerrardi]
MVKPMYRIWLQFFTLLGGFVVPGVRRVSGMEIFTSSEVEAVNGTNVRLKCTFSSVHPVSPQTVIVSWNFRPLHPGPEESVFYYQETPYPPTHGRFKDRAVWSGDIMRQDASITLHEVPPTFNGTYTCQVHNLPDVHGKSGEIILKVVSKVGLSEIGILAAAVGGACGIILLILGIFVLVKFYKRRHMDKDVELHTREQEWKDPTVCKPEEALHLKIVEKAIEVESSDEESEPSSGDDDEEEEDDDDDDDDDDDGGDDDDD